MHIKTLDTSITETNISKWIDSFKNEILPERSKLYSYYKGKDQINKLPTDLDKCNGRTINEIHSNYAKMIVSNASSYLVGKPITYSFKEKSLETSMKELNYNNDESAENLTLAKNQSIFGVAYELMGIDEDKSIYIKNLSPLNTFFVDDSSILAKKVCAITYWTVKDSLTNQDITKGYIYNKDEVIQFTKDGTVKFDERVVNPFKPCMPVYEFKNNDESCGDFEPIVDLLSAYNKLITVNFDDVDGIANAILALYNMQLERTATGKLKRSSVIEAVGASNMKAEYIYKKLDKEYVEYLRNAIRDDVFSITNIPDLTDDSFARNSSGVALSYKLIGFDNLHAEKAGYFKKGIMDRIKCFINYKNLSDKEIKPDEVEITFYKNLPKNIERDKQIAELYNQGVISLETALDKIELVADTNEELTRIKREKPVIEDLNVNEE